MAFYFTLSCLRSYVLLGCKCMYVYLATNIDGWWLIETKETALVLNPLFYGVYIESLKEMSYDGSLSRMISGKWIEM